DTEHRDPNASYRTRNEYDPLRRLSRVWLQRGGVDRLVERSVYGEQHPHSAALKLRARRYLLLDSSGLTRSERYDFKGNLEAVTRKVAREFRQETDWQSLESLFATPTIDLAALPVGFLAK